MQRLILAAILIAPLAACSGNVKQVSCDQDWYEIGARTAVAGKSVRTFEEYKRACPGSLGEEAKSRYVDGYTQGIIEYCTYDNGYALGSQNYQAREICPVEVRTAYMNGYNMGKKDFEERMLRMESEARRIERDTAVEQSKNMSIPRPGN